MPAWRRTVLSLLLAACVAAAADPALLSLAPPDAKVFLGANLSRFLASPIGQTVAAQAQSSQPQIQQFAQLAGFDPLRGFQEILVASPAVEKSNRGLVLVKGAFGGVNLAALAGKSGGVLSTYGGVQVLGGKKPADGWITLLDPATAAFGDPDSVRSAIDRRGAGPGPESGLRARIDELGNNYDLWLLSAAPLSNLASGASGEQFGKLLQGDILKAVEMVGGGIRFGTDLVVALEAVSRTDKDASALADVIKFFVGMAQMSAQKDPKAAESLQFLQRLQLTAVGNVTRMSLTVPAAELEKMIKQSQRPAAATQTGVTIQSSPRDMGTVVVR